MLANSVSVWSSIALIAVFMGHTPVEGPTAGAERDELAEAVGLVVAGAEGNMY